MSAHTWKHLFTGSPTPRLEKLEIGFEIGFFNQITLSVPCFLQFMITSEKLGFESARTEFSDGLHVKDYPRGEAGAYALFITVRCRDLDWQVPSAAQVSVSLSQMFCAVEHLSLRLEGRSRLSEDHNGVDRTEWRELLRSFSNVKTFQIDNELVGELSLCLQLADGELPLELLPELQEITYPGSGDDGDAFTSFIDSRKNAGRTVTLVRP
jgi:hypothetical protein